eukprot:scaffold1954_cov268-Pinguiococcus_pyrenoidosus.AAC.127
MARPSRPSSDSSLRLVPQEPEWFGPDCSLRHCPSGDDPMTEANEEDCGGVAPAGGTAVTLERATASLVYRSN